MKLIRKTVRIILDYFFGRVPKLHKIHFGPLRGEKIFMSFNDGPSMFFGIHELDLLKVEKKYINNNDVVYDIGAHVGYTSLFFSKLVSDNGAVHAFELIPSTGEMLSETIKNAEKNNIFIHNVGLGSKYTKKDFLFDDRNMGSITFKMENYKSNSSKRFKALCEIYPLDQYIFINNLEKPNFIKVDIEGAEIEFLNGAVDTISNYKPDLMIEFHGLSLLKSGYELLHDIGYTMIVKDNIKIDKTFINNLSRFYGESCFCFSNGKYDNVVF